MRLRDETKEWADSHRFTRLMIVTSVYHMPRSLTELRRVMPGITLMPYPVLSASFQTERWWMHAASLKLAFTEYVKFIPSAARYGVARLLRWETSALAGNSEAGILSN